MACCFQSGSVGSNRIEPVFSTPSGTVTITGGGEGEREGGDGGGGGGTPQGKGWGGPWGSQCQG